MDMQEMIFEALKEIRSDVKEIREEQIKQGFDIKENKENLAEHMKRTELLETRVDKLEDVEVGKSYLYKWLAGIATLIGVLTGLYQAFKSKIS